MAEHTVKLLIDNKRRAVLLAEADEKFVEALGAELDNMYTLYDLLHQTLPARSSLVNLCNSYNNLYQEQFDSDKVYCCLSCFKSFRFYVDKMACPACREKMFEIPSHVELPLTVPEGNYMITDDLEIKPMSALSTLNQTFTRLSVDGVDALEEKVVQLTSDEVTKLVRASLQPTKILTDFFLNKAVAKAEDKAETKAAVAKAEDEAETKAAVAKAEADSVEKEEFVVVDQDEVDKLKFN